MSVESIERQSQFFFARRQMAYLMLSARIDASNARSHDDLARTVPWARMDERVRGE